MEENRIWERQEGESSQAYEAFQTYRSLGPRRRHEQVAQKLGKSKSQIQKWGAQWEWKNRIHAYDVFQERLLEDEFQEVRREVMRKHLDMAKMIQVPTIKYFNRLRDDDEAIRQIPAGTATMMLKTAIDIESEILGTSKKRIDIELSTSSEDDIRAMDKQQLMEMLRDVVKKPKP